MKKIGKTVLKYIIIYISMLILFLLLLTSASLIPSNKIKENVEETTKILNEQTNANMIPIRGWSIGFDNYTDALMINTAYSIDSKAPFYSAMVARKNYIPGATQITFADRTGDVGRASKYPYELDQVGELNDIINGEVNEAFEYARYWHGYLVLLRPALVFFNISQIRIIITVILILLLIALLILLIKNVNFLSAVAVGIRNTRSRLFIFRKCITRNISIFNSYDVKLNHCIKKRKYKKCISNVLYNRCTNIVCRFINNTNNHNWFATYDVFSMFAKRKTNKIKRSNKNFGYSYN